MNVNQRYAYVTLLGTDDYLPGTLCLAASLKRVKSRYPLLVLCFKSVSSDTMEKLKRRGLQTRVLVDTVTVPGINQGGYERWNYTFDKLQVFNLLEYEKVVFLDSDMLIVKNIDHLFGMPHMSAVVADVYDQPDCTELNSGLLVIEPSAKESQGLIDTLLSDRLSQLPMFGDQDVIRAYFSDWASKPELRLPVGYNLFYPFMDQFYKANGKRRDIYVIHFVYGKKPWQYTFKEVLKKMKREGRFYVLYYFYLMHQCGCLSFKRN